MNKIINLFKKSLQHELISGTFYLFVGGIIGSFLSFVYNLLLARTLTHPQYGTYTSLLSFEALIIIPAASLSSVIVRFASHYLAKGENDKAAHFYKRMSIIWIFLGMLVFFLTYLAHPILQSYLHIKDTLLIVALGFGAAVSYMGIVNAGFLQSMTRFKFLSASAVLASFSKLIIGGLLVFLGAGAVGGLFGIAVLPLVAYVIAFWPLRKLLKTKDSPENYFETKAVLKYAIIASIGILSLSSFISSDVILVKHFFTESEAGLYGGLSIIGKVIFYFTTSIPSVMFPLLIRRHAKGEKYKQIYYLALLLVFIPSLAITLFYYLFPVFTTQFFLGKTYSGISPYLGLFGIFLTIFNLNNISVSYFLSLKKLKISFFVPLFALLQIVLIYLFHANFYQIIHSSIIASSLLLLVLLLYYKIQKD